MPSPNVSVDSVAVLELDAQAIGNAVDEGEVGGDGAGIVDGSVIQALIAELLDVCLCHLTRALGELERIPDEGKVLSRNVGLERSRSQGLEFG